MRNAVTEEDAVLWLSSDGTETRQLFERFEGFEVWIDYKWESTGATESGIPLVLASVSDGRKVSHFSGLKIGPL